MRSLNLLRQSPKRRLDERSLRAPERITLTRGRVVWAVAFVSVCLIAFSGLTRSLGLPHLWNLNALMTGPETAPPAQRTPPPQRPAVLQRTPPPAKPSPTGYQPSFRDIVGANGFFDEPLMKAMKVGAIRTPFYWDSIEPSRGQWNWKATDPLANAGRYRGVLLVPMLGFTAHWAKSGPDGFSPPQNSKDWTDFVSAVVSRYSAAPYNVRYFQIWNEPTSDAGFFKGTDQQYIDVIYIPAARIIREHHCFVVFGGWGQGDGVPRFNQVLNYHNAWQWTDILDIHYYPLSAMQTLYSQWVATGKCKGVWQTEVGNVNNPVMLTNLYSGLYNWAKTSGNWSSPEQYKLFWYNAAGAGCAICLAVIPGNGPEQPTANGQALEKLAQSTP